jgi:hypothetical protein
VKLKKEREGAMNQQIESKKGLNLKWYLWMIPFLIAFYISENTLKWILVYGFIPVIAGIVVYFGAIAKLSSNEEGVRHHGNG